MRLKLKNGIVLKFRMSKKMLQDYAECKRLARVTGGEGKECKNVALILELEILPCVRFRK